MYCATFLPCVGVEFDADGNVLGADIDWNDTFTNVGWTDADGTRRDTDDGEDPRALAACEHLDSYLDGDKSGAALLRHIADLIDIAQKGRVTPA